MKFERNLASDCSVSQLDSDLRAVLDTHALIKYISLPRTAIDLSMRDCDDAMCVVPSLLPRNIILWPDDILSDIIT